MNQVDNRRLTYLDGIRGIMAINVVFNHFFVVFFPDLYLLDNGENFFNATPFNALYNGTTAVQYFFVLSGFLTAYLMFQKNELKAKTVILKSINRYFRLIPVIFVVVFLVYIFMKLDLLYNMKIGREMAELYCNFEPSFVGMLKDAFIDTFINKSAYNGPFWTIKFDFFGYIATLVMVYIIKNIKPFYKFRKVLIVLYTIALTYISVNLFSFGIGMLIADICVTEREGNEKLKKIFKVIAGIVGLYFACITYLPVGIYRWVENINIFNKTQVFCAFGCALCIYALFHSESLQKFFSNKIFKFFGKISFTIYSFHWLCILSLQNFLHYVFSQTLSYEASAWLSFGITLPVIILVAYIMYFLLEKRRIIDVEKMVKKFEKN